MRIPTHLGVIPDGNRRWANHLNKEKQDGYQFGLNPGVKLLHLARDVGIKEISYYGFTTDNCKRPAEQVSAFTKACVDAVRLIAEEPVSLLVLGNAASRFFPDALLPYTQRKNLNGGGIKINFLVNYGWEWDLSNLQSPGIHRKIITEGLQSKDISRIDYIIRWGGMRRLSGFLPVQSVYADFYVVDNLWPDFSAQDFNDALEWYQHQDVTLGG